MTVTPGSSRAYVFAFIDAEGAPRAVADDTGRLVATQLDALATLFAARLSDRGLRVSVHSKTAQEVGDVIVASGVDPEDAPERVFFIEATATDPEDAVRWTIELADRVPLVPREDA